VIYPMTPFASDRNLGAAYNRAMALLPDDSWACFMDHDAMPTTREWFRQLEEAVAFLPDAGAIVGMANRIGPEWQRTGERNGHDIRLHRKHGAERLKVRTLLDVTCTKGFGGVVFCLSKAVWREVGGFIDGLLCVDHGLHFALQRAGRTVWLHEGIYFYHWRRACGDELPDDTPRVANCPCRGPETAPTRRIALPEATR
jgi:GT2 family glycosyltransferase